LLQLRRAESSKDAPSPARGGGPNASNPSTKPPALHPPCARDGRFSASIVARTCAPSPACGGGPGWGDRSVLPVASLLNHCLGSNSPIPSFPRPRGKGRRLLGRQQGLVILLRRAWRRAMPPRSMNTARALPPPRAGEGRGGGNGSVLPVASVLNYCLGSHSPIPSFPRPRGKGRRLLGRQQGLGILLRRAWRRAMPPRSMNTARTLPRPPAG